MSVLEEFNVFVAAIFYIGKGKKSRPYEHFHEAVKFERNEGNKTKVSGNPMYVVFSSPVLNWSLEIMYCFLLAGINLEF